MSVFPEFSVHCLTLEDGADTVSLTSVTIYYNTSRQISENPDLKIFGVCEKVDYEASSIKGLEKIT